MNQLSHGSNKNNYSTNIEIKRVSNSYLSTLRTGDSTINGPYYYGDRLSIKISPNNSKTAVYSIKINGKEKFGDFGLLYGEHWEEEITLDSGELNINIGLASKHSEDKYSTFTVNKTISWNTDVYDETSSNNYAGSKTYYSFTLPLVYTRPVGYSIEGTSNGAGTSAITINKRLNLDGKYPDISGNFEIISDGNMRTTRSYNIYGSTSGNSNGLCSFNANAKGYIKDDRRKPNGGFMAPIYGGATIQLTVSKLEVWYPVN